MKAISIQQPYADLILTGQKDIENRTWKLPSWILNKRVYVHAGKIWDGYKDDNWAETFGIYNDPARRGMILGEVTFIECVSASTIKGFSQWFYGPYGWVIENPVRYDKPIPYKGQLGFFEVPDAYI